MPRVFDVVEFKPHRKGDHWVNTQAPAVRPIRTEQRPSQHERAAPTTVSSAWRDSSEPQKPLEDSLRLTVNTKNVVPDLPTHGTRP